MAKFFWTSQFRPSFIQFLGSISGVGLYGLCIVYVGSIWFHVQIVQGSIRSISTFGTPPGAASLQRGAFGLRQAEQGRHRPRRRSSARLPLCCLT